jgi:hypothetical protein
MNIDNNNNVIFNNLMNDYYINNNINIINNDFINNNNYDLINNNYYLINNNYNFNDINDNNNYLNYEPMPINVFINIMFENVDQLPMLPDETPVETFTRLNIQINDEEVNSEETCSVCLESNVNCETNCSHHFHVGCLSQWINRNNSCPLCRGNVSSVNTNL